MHNEFILSDLATPEEKNCQRSKKFRSVNCVIIKKPAILRSGKKRTRQKI
jgi:hypothetical protein